jgi:lysophospholipid acyltransferase (LPLAT)-like uncharacterized protein
MSSRKLTPTRKIAYQVLTPILKLTLKSLWSTYRVRVVGSEHILRFIRDRKPIIPCYWHQMHIICSYYMVQLQKEGLKLGFLISPSMDGEIAAMVMQSWGARIIRGSSTRTGARSLQQLYRIITREKVSTVNTPDGPQGPVHAFKPGAIMLSRMTSAPIIPLAYAADRSWQLRTWDKFLIPKPFANVLLLIGEPQEIKTGSKFADLQSRQEEMEEVMGALIVQAEKLLSEN